MEGSPGESRRRSGEARPTLLLLDGDARNHRLLTGLLRADDYQVEPCRSGAAALARVARTPGPDALVLDVSPADQEALAAVAELEASYPELAIFVITAHPQLVRALAGKGPSRLHVFIKPLDYPALLSALARRCPGSRGRASGPL